MLWLVLCGVHLNRASEAVEEADVPSITATVTGNSDHLVTLNSTQKVTIYCYSDFIPSLRLITDKCKECEEVHDCTWDWVNAGKRTCYRCKEVCERKDTSCPKSTGEYSTCMVNVRSDIVPRKYHCMGFTKPWSDTLKVNIDVVRHTGPGRCFGGVAAIPMTAAQIDGHSSDPTNVTYNTPMRCVNASNVVNLNAGHLISTGYTISKIITEDQTAETEDDFPDFLPFCKIIIPELWSGSFQLGTVFSCNGTLHKLDNEFPCLKLSPESRLMGIPVPSLEHCNQTEMVGVIIGMIVVMILCYAVFIICFRIWKCFCKCGRQDKEELPLAQNSSHSRLTESYLVVCKQESNNSITQNDLATQKSASVTDPPAHIVS